MRFHRMCLVAYLYFRIFSVRRKSPFIALLFFFLICIVWQESDLFLLGAESHKQKRKHSSNEHCYRGKGGNL